MPFKVNISNTDLGETQFLAPAFYLLGKFGKLRGGQ